MFILLSGYAIAAHATLGLLNETGLVVREETAWSAGTRLCEKGNWATYSVYCICNNGGGIGGN